MRKSKSLEIELIEAIVCPRPGFKDDSVVKFLNKVKSQNVAILTFGYITAKINPQSIKEIEALALVHPKQPIKKFL